MSRSLVLLRTLHLAAEQECRNHNQQVLSLLEQELLALAPLIGALHPLTRPRYEQHVDSLKGLVQKKKEEYAS